ncbi:MAG: GGDEF domain-containing protein [Xanthobacteraceae bacterium]|nr:GGDEF domain-containing protein [Xanthobacteraceae bacterium]
MSLQGPILIIAGRPGSDLVQAFTNAGASPVVEASWAEAPSAANGIKPAAIVVCDPGISDFAAANALSQWIAAAVPYVPAVVRARDDAAPALPDALPVSDDAPVERLIARVTSAQRLRTLHATVLGRAQTLKDERNIIAELPAGDPLEDATALLVGRGRHHATLSVAIGERMGLIGALSVDTAERCLAAREVDGIVIGDGLSASAVEAFLETIATNALTRALPLALLAARGDVPALPNLVTARDPLVLLQRALPLMRARALETAMKRLLHSIEHKGMIDARTGLLNADAFGRALELAIEDAAERKTTFSLARFAFDVPLDRRIAIDTARLVSRLVRDTDFACRQDDGAILFVFGDTGLRDAHVAARRLASVLKHTMLRPGDKPGVSPAVTLATLKPGDTALSLFARVAPRPVAAE